ncbi:MAG: glycosyltransferase family 2 protein [Anaerolineales bacterium]
MKQDHVINPCPICGGSKQIYLFEIHSFSVISCEGCGLAFSSPSILPHGIDHFSIPLKEIPNNSLEGRTELEACKKYLQMLAERSNDIHNILLIAEPGHYFATLAEDSGYTVIQHVSVSELENGIVLHQAVDAVVIIYQLEKTRSVKNILEQVYTALRPGGELFMVALSLDSRSARFFGQSWIGWHPENKYYFDNNNIQLLLWRFGFGNVWLNKDLRLYTLAHINERASGFPETWITRIICALYKILPSNFHDLYFRLPSSGIIVTARKAERREIPVLSIVLPVYNEGSTFSVLMEQLLDLELNNIQKEIIIVESNSQDNSRELVLNYKDRPEVKIVLQEKPKGKGNAVREGMEHATGDILLIQDADLEYDLNDYVALLEPILTYRNPFILGARHGGKWKKMRHFSDQVQLSAYFNFGHILFTTLLNVLYGQRMKDPFTMFKVFRRDCLYNLKFECNRFDFDFELVIKLIRKGYSPLEIPVNYNSRSFKEGKKVNMFRDPFTWIRASFKYRFAKITRDGSESL